MAAVVWVERAMREYLASDKINLAALGNAVPHLHWHIIARYKWDAHFPASIWGAPHREVAAELWKTLEGQQSKLEHFLSNNADTLVETIR